jgi:hypothetical protein
MRQFVEGSHEIRVRGECQTEQLETGWVCFPCVLVSERSRDGVGTEVSNWKDGRWNATYEHVPNIRCGCGPTEEAAVQAYGKELLHALKQRDKKEEVC